MAAELPSQPDPFHQQQTTSYYSPADNADRKAQMPDGFMSYDQYNAANSQQNAQYQQQQQQQAQMAVQNMPRAPLPEETKSMKWWKLGLHITALVAGIISLSLGLATMSYGFDGYVVVASSPGAVIAIIWSIAELITRCARRFKAGIHPGAHVGVCLIGWLIASIGGGVQATEYALSVGYERSCYPINDSYFDDYDDCEDPLGGHGAMVLAAAIFTWIVFVCYFTLFVVACIDTHKRRLARRTVYVYTAPPQQFWGPPNQGWQQLPQGANIEMQPSPVPSPRPAPEMQYQAPVSSPPQAPVHPSDASRVTELESDRSIAGYYTPGTAQ